MTGIQNIFTVDLEDGIYTSEFRNSITVYKIQQIKDILIKNTLFLLDILDKNHSTATFFILGKLADDLPDLIRTISVEGHEIASHGYEHTNLRNQNPAKFKKDLEMTSDAIFSACGQRPTGYRAPYFSISLKTLWALDVLQETGYLYDSSVQPFGYHLCYGMNKAYTEIFRFQNGMIEIPLTVAKYSGIKVPCSGGAYFRFYPFKFFMYNFRRAWKQNNYSIFYIHPWELGGSIYWKKESSFSKFRKYYNSEKTISRLEKIFSEFRFVSISRYLINSGKDYDFRKFN